MMSIATKTDAKSDFEERSVVATRSLCATLGLPPLKPSELKYLSTALAEVATQEIAYNAEFKQALLCVFQGLVPQKPQKAAAKPRAKKNVNTVVLPKPLKHVPMSAFNPNDTPDPLLLYEAYGDEHLPQVLDTFALRTLKEMAAKIRAQHPTTKPSSLANKGAVISYIIAMLPRLQREQ